MLGVSDAGADGSAWVARAPSRREGGAKRAGAVESSASASGVGSTRADANVDVDVDAYTEA
ncbi:hypothetical protein Ms3S1_36860 [Methylosinus sp. 3S-1]|uniref:Uncharacterized protein n=1 Tax=Methylosinus trichosporium (strain ATCC 35070 / NCIMB 11131 / UNIQEM 75 / OB3b) TaxID=595536 RepID=A0A2D2D3Y9_METT3|nr:hypothetical protein CQW49_18660 [Methylosinus trichosporium OB3b]OBS51236.1 hypothetical protein A8B73_17435 [Methylosinus sp. 3S-1]